MERLYSDVAEWVYFVSGAGFVKIGTSVRPFDRMRQLQLANGSKLEMLGITPGGRTRERQIQQLFADIHSHAEWFRDTPELRLFIDNICVPWDCVG
jgi:hypothetical protein